MDALRGGTSTTMTTPISGPTNLIQYQLDLGGACMPNPAGTVSVCRRWWAM
jgi:hypothetical protein